MKEVETPYASPKIITVLVGNKTDLVSEREIKLEEGQAFADEQTIQFLETSAKETRIMKTTVDASRCLHVKIFIGMVTFLIWLSVFFESRIILDCTGHTKPSDFTSRFTLRRYNKLLPVPDCVAKQQIVCVKTHKTGGTTLARIIEQYAVDHKLQIVRKIGENGSIHFAEKFNYSSPELFLPPVGVEPGDYDNYKYDVFTLHARYNRPVYDSFMKGTPFYLTILRNPVTQFESAFDVFSIGSMVNSSISKEDRLNKFMNNIDYYWKNVTKSKQRYGHNSQLWDLGVDPLECPNQYCLDYLIRRFDAEIDLVLINELYDESLLIMKNKLCWEFEDILYIPRNRRKERTNMTDDVRQKITEWNAADTKLYSYFVKRLKKHILEYGPDFKADLVAFREMNQFLYDICVSSEVINQKKIPKIDYSLSKNISSSPCKHIKSTDVCSFKNNYQLDLNLNSVCRHVTSKPFEMNEVICEMINGESTVS